MSINAIIVYLKSIAKHLDDDDYDKVLLNIAIDALTHTK